MFSDLSNVDWEMLRVPEAPSWIEGLVSVDTLTREESFLNLRDTHIYERPDLAQYVVPYIIRILASQEENADIPLLLEFLIALRSYAVGFINRDTAIVDAQTVKSQIDGSLETLKKLALSDDSEIKESAISLINDIEQN
jgi:hypothetical protein